MKKLLLSLLATFSIEQTIISIDLQSALIFNAFTKKIQLSDEEMVAGINLVQNIPSQEEAFNLSIQSKQDEICYELKNDKKYVYNCMSKQRAAEFIIAYIQVCIEQNLDSELKKAKKLLHDLLKATKGSTVTLTSNGFPKEGIQRNIKIDSPAGQFLADISEKKDTNDQNLSKIKAVVELNTDDVTIKSESDSLQKVGSVTNTNGHLLSFRYLPENNFRFTRQDKKVNFSEQISVTHQQQPNYDSQDGLHHEKFVTNVKIDSKEAGPITLTSQETSQGKDRYNLNSERSINLTTTNSSTNAEWTTNPAQEITSLNVASKYKKPETNAQ